MKMCAGVIVLVLLVATGSNAQQQNVVGFAVGFGPKDCVRLTRSAVGSCVISTHCKGLDTSHTEFAFNCVTKNNIKRHSYGTGGFEDSENFDSEVKCDKCEPTTTGGFAAAPLQSQSGLQAPRMPAFEIEVAVVPTAMPKLNHLHVHLPEHHKHHVHGAVGLKSKRLRASHRKGRTAKTGMGANIWPFTSSKDTKDEAKPTVSNKSEVATYGPEHCVSTFKNSKGECMVQTKCKGVNITDYEFGLRCVDKHGVAVNHLFGEGSFDEEERFDTLIPCHKCMGLEDGYKAAEEAAASDYALSKVKRYEAAASDDVNSSALSKLAPLANDIKELTDTMRGINDDVQKLNAAVFKPAKPLGLSPAAAPAADLAAPAKTLGPAVAKKPSSPPVKAVTAYLQKGRDDGDDGDYDEDQESEEDEGTSEEQESSAAAPEGHRRAEYEGGEDADGEEDDGEAASEEDGEEATSEEQPRSAAPKKQRAEEDSGEDADVEEEDGDAAPEEQPPAAAPKAQKPEEYADGDDEMVADVVGESADQGPSMALPQLPRAPPKHPALPKQADADGLKERHSKMMRHVHEFKHDEEDDGDDDADGKHVDPKSKSDDLDSVFNRESQDTDGWS